MILNVIKHQNNHEVQNYSKFLNTSEEINRVKNSIRLYLSVKKRNIITRGLPYEELNENRFRGFVSDIFQFIETDDYIDITTRGTNTQIQFVMSYETTTIQLVA